MRCPVCHTHMRDDPAFAFVQCINKKCERAYKPEVLCRNILGFAATWRKADDKRRHYINTFPNKIG
jgi:hypothetical protein